GKNELVNGTPDVVTGVKTDEGPRQNGGQQINLRQIADGKAAEKERVSYNFDDVVSSKQKKSSDTMMPTRRNSPGRIATKSAKAFVSENRFQKTGGIEMFKGMLTGSTLFAASRTP